MKYAIETLGHSTIVFQSNSEKMLKRLIKQMHEFVNLVALSEAPVRFERSEKNLSLSGESLSFSQVDSEQNSCGQQQHKQNQGLEIHANLVKRARICWKPFAN